MENGRRGMGLNSLRKDEEGGKGKVGEAANLDTSSQHPIHFGIRRGTPLCWAAWWIVVSPLEKYKRPLVCVVRNPVAAFSAINDLLISAKSRCCRAVMWRVS